MKLAAAVVLFLVYAYHMVESLLINGVDRCHNRAQIALEYIYELKFGFILETCCFYFNRKKYVGRN